jgi:hypothetical protein
MKELCEQVVERFEVSTVITIKKWPSHAIQILGLIEHW